MELTVKKTDLVKELSLGQGVVEKKTTIPVLSNVLLEAEGNTVRFTVTDLELGIRSSCPATVKKGGSTTLPARKLLDFVRLLPDAELSIKVSENHSATIVCGRSRTRIAGMSRENFPDLPAMPAPITKIPAALLATVISKTIFSVANEESRYTLTGGLMLLKEDALVMVTTDGHRLAYIEASHAFDGISGELQALVPKKGMSEAMKLAVEGGDSLVIDFATDENHLFFQCGGRLLISRKLTGQFPDYNRVLPKERKATIVLGRDETQAAIRRVSQFADDRSHAIRIEVEPENLRLASSGSEIGESEESLPIEYSGEKVKIGFNSQYLLDFLGVAESETVELGIQGEDSAGEFQLPGLDGYDYRYVVMPMRI
jgi:DNA polymerase-3 subunit beta